MSRGRTVLLLVLLALPGASAAPVEGALVADGEVRVPSGADADFLAAAALVRIVEDEGPLVFRLEAPLLKVQRYEQRFHQVDPGLVDPAKVAQGPVLLSSYTLENVVVSLAEGDHKGWAGVYLPSQGGRLHLDAWDAVRILAEATPKVANAENAANERVRIEPQMSSYRWEGDAPLLTGEGGGGLRMEGPAALKVMGPDLTFHGRNTTTWATGEFHEGDGAVGEVVRRWFFLSFERGTFEAGGRGDFRLAAASADVRWTGVATLRARDADLRIDGEPYRPSEGIERLEGDLRATMTPLDAPGRPRVHLALEGVLEDSSLAGAGAGRPAPGSAFRLWAPALLAGVALAAVAAYAVRRKAVPARGAEASVSPEDRLALARIAAAEDRLPDAVAHVRQARAQAPRSVRLLLEEASFLGAMGRVEEALAHYARAAELDPEGDAEFQAAVLLLQSEGDGARAEPLVVVALEKNPILVLEILYDVTGTFQPLRGRPRVEGALERARRALGDG